MRRLISAMVLLFVPAWGGSCAPGPGKPDLRSDNPELKIPAIKQAAASGDRAVIAELVKALSHKDVAIRFYAIEALERLTGDRMGYRYYDDESERRAAVERWDKWFNEQRAAGAR